MKGIILGFLLALFGLVAAEAQINNPQTVTGASPIVVSGNQVGIQAPDRTVTTSTGVTIISTDFGGQVNVNNASAQNVNTPTSMSAGQTFTVVNQGAGVLTIVNGGVAVNGLSFTTIDQYGFITCTANSSSSADCAGVQGAGGSGTVTSVDIIQGTNVTLSGTCNSTTTISCTINSTGGSGSGTIGTPQGRLTLASGTPVMTVDEAAKSTIYYDCYRGNNVPYYTGSADNLDSIASCEVSLTMPTSGTGVTNSAGVFDIWWVHGGANRICVATNGSGGGWASDTGGSTTARGTGYSQVHNTRGYWTNVNSIADCYNGSTNYGSISADQGTYLGTIYTTAAGKTTVNFAPTAAVGGTASVVGLWNAYNRVSIVSVVNDSTTSYSYTTNTWREADNSGSNSIIWVDGLQQTSIDAISEWGQTGSSIGPTVTGINVDSTTASGNCASNYFSPGNVDVILTVMAECVATPYLGAHYLQEMELGATGGTFYGSAGIGGSGVLRYKAEM